MDIIFSEIAEHISSFSLGLFLKIKNLPQKKNEEELKGIHIFAREISTNNFLSESIEYPSSESKILCLEQAFRCEFHKEFSSLNSANEELYRLCGCVQVKLGNSIYQFSSAGFKTAEENIFCSIANLTEALKMTFDEVIFNILKYGGLLPESIIDGSSYLYKAYKEFFVDEIEI